MANLNALKNLFSKLKPAAKTVANYGDDVAKAAVNYGDDVAQMAFANADDLAAVTAQTDDIANIISKENPILNSAPVEDPVLWDTDYIEWYDDNGINTDFTLNGVRTIPENTDDLIAHLNNADAELDSLSQLDPDAYKSGRTYAPPRNNIIAPEMFGGYDNRLVGSFNYPDGFIDPESAAMYYDSLERGAIPKEYADAARRIKEQYALQNASNRAYGLPTLYEALETRLGPQAFMSPNKSDQFMRSLGKVRVRRK